MAPSRTSKPWKMPASGLMYPCRTGSTKHPCTGPPSSPDFATQDRYLCPAGQPLHRFRTEYQAEKVEYRADAATCNTCPLKAQCTDSQRGDNCIAPFMRTTSNEYRATSRWLPTRRLYASARCGLNPYSLKPADWHGLRRFRLRLHGPRQL